MYKNKKIAIVHEWLVDYSGSERLTEQLLNIFPDADLFAIVEFLPDNLKWFIKNKKVTTSFIQKLPFAKKKYRNYLPLMPFAIEQLDVSNYDVVISVSHAVSKGIITNVNQIHICYCCSPIRYAWDLYHQYLKESKLQRGFKGFIAKSILHYIRFWDLTTTNRVDYFIAISKYIVGRINKNYRREASYIYPPVNVEDFTLHLEKSDFYFAASRLVPYKKIDLIVEAFSKMPDKKLVVIGDGPDFEKIKRLVTPNITMLGYQPFPVLKEHLQKAKAFVFAADEDFGIIPLEAQACGTPVIAYGRGANLETVLGGITGLYFQEQTLESLISTVNKFEEVKGNFDPINIRQHAETFSIKRFQSEFKAFVEEKIDEKWT
ncbi:MAG TPA: glycosyltransferase family 4 protein [Flavobacterium sp.]|jgi:glycosyltransferase involved in cell wall biosynthesis